MTPVGGGGPAGVIDAIGNWEEEYCQSYRSGDGRGSAQLRILSSSGSDLRGISRCGRSCPPASIRLSPRRFVDLKYSGLKSICAVQCPHGRYADCATRIAVRRPADGGRGSSGCHTAEHSITFLPASFAKEPRAARSKPWLRAGNGREHFPFDPMKTSVIETPRSGALNLSHGPRISAAFR